MSRALRTAVFCLSGALLVAALSPPAAAQVPSAPELPDEVESAIAQVQGTVVPIISDAAIAAQPAANAVGFLLRPGCASAGSAIVVAALLGTTVPLPVNPGIALTPVFIFCGAAFEPGPVDPVFEQVDAASGPQLQDTAQPVLDQAATGIAPARPALSEACTGVALLGSAPKQVPPPANRLDAIAAICGG